MITLDSCQRGDEFLVADHEPDAPSGHVVALRQREELHRDMFRARDLHYRGRLPAVKHDVHISEIVDHEYVVLPG